MKWDGQDYLVPVWEKVLAWHQRIHHEMWCDYVKKLRESVEEMRNG